MGALRRVFVRGAPSATKSFGQRYEHVVLNCLQAKPLVLGVAVLSLISVTFLPIGTQFFPDDDRDLLYVDVWLPEGSSLISTDAATRQVESLLRKISHIDSEEFTGERLARFYSSIGSSGPRFALGVAPNPPASNFAQIIVQTSDPIVTEGFVQDIRQAAAAEVAGARVIPRKLALGPPIDAPLGVRIYGRRVRKPRFWSGDRDS